jgi:hypothetical protein
MRVRKLLPALWLGGWIALVGMPAIAATGRAAARPAKQTFAEKRAEWWRRRAARLDARRQFASWVDANPGIRDLYAGAKRSQGVNWLRAGSVAMAAFGGFLVPNSDFLAEAITYGVTSAAGVGVFFYQQRVHNDLARGDVVREAKHLKIAIPSGLESTMRQAGSFGFTGRRSAP